jgi:hypothetical protein
VRITAAAIRHDGKVYTGRRHCQIIRDIVASTSTKRVLGEQGFVLEDGRFVNREDAAFIALASGQIKELKFNTTKLFSEDLW